MKYFRLIITTMLIMMASLPSMAYTTDSDAENYRSSVLSYLREEGYAPKIDDDGDVQFKYQGETYFISVQAYDKGYYVTFLSISDLDDLEIGKVLVALDQTEKSLKFVRCYTTENYKFAVIQICLYCETLKDFSRMFKNSMEIITTADERFIDNMVKLIDD